MSTFGDELIQSLGEALAHARGEGSGIVHEFPDPRQGRRRVGGPAMTLLRILDKEPEAVRRALGA